MLDRFLAFGKIGAQRISEYLFWAGTVLSVFTSYLFGKYLYMTSTYMKQISYVENGQEWFSGKPVNNLPLGICGAIAAFIVSIALLKVACEVLYLVIRSLEAYVANNSRDDI